MTHSSRAGSLGGSAGASIETQPERPAAPSAAMSPRNSRRVFISIASLVVPGDCLTAGARARPRLDRVDLARCSFGLSPTDIDVAAGAVQRNRRLQRLTLSCRGISGSGLAGRAERTPSAFRLRIVVEKRAVEREPRSAQEEDDAQDFERLYDAVESRGDVHGL